MTPEQQCKSGRYHPPHLYTKAGTVYRCPGLKKPS